MTHNAADRKSIRSAEKLALAKTQRLATVIVDLASTPAGREWLWEELCHAHIFNALPIDPITMNRAEGERNAGLRLLGQIMTYCPEDFLSMMREANERDRTAAVATSERPSVEEPGRELEGSGDSPEGWRDPEADRSTEIRVG